MRQVVGDVPLGGSPFPPIADYAFLSDCEVCALVAPSGNIEWMSLPRFDGPSIFGCMLDRDAGPFHLAPVDTTVPAGRRYLPGTMVLETTWGTRTAVADVTTDPTTSIRGTVRRLTGARLSPPPSP